MIVVSSCVLSMEVVVDECSLPAWQMHSEQQRLVHSQPAKLRFLEETNKNKISLFNVLLFQIATRIT